MLGQERAALAQRLDGAVDVDGVVGQFALALRAVCEQDADAAVDVELRVAERGAGLRGQRVELIAVLAQVRGERLEQRGALVEGQPPQRGTADLAAVPQRGGEVDAGRGDPRDLLPGGGVVQRSALIRRRAPLPGDVAAQQLWSRDPSTLLNRLTDRTFRN
ncbi:hypothetical protein GCM10020366_08490 [Saccharopolyspora gregorii]|uniref:Uncharacterized protein n=1 Tax=Saccharopolyspora gregorii TaxID=33914 RepID=A0ABP6RI14_9PSEU